MMRWANRAAILAAFAAPAAAQDFPSEGTVFVYETSTSEAGEVIATGTTEIEIVQVDRDVVIFSQCDLSFGECSLGVTDGIFPGFFDFYSVGQNVPMRLVPEMIRAQRIDTHYDPGQYAPYVDGRAVTWQRDGGNVQGRFTQECCVTSETGDDLWVMTFEETFGGGYPTTMVQHVDPALGWFVYERSVVVFATMPDLVVEHRLQEVRAPD